MKRVPRFALVALALAWLAAPAAQAQVMKQVPSDALMVLKVNHLQDTNKKVATLMQKLGVDMLQPELADPLAWLQKSIGVKDGLDKTGEAALAILNKMEGRQPPFLALVPITDYKAFVGNFPDAKAEGDLTLINIPRGPGQLYIADWGKYAALAADKELLAKKGDGLDVAGPAGKELDGKDIVYYFNMPAIRKVALPKLKENHQQFVQNIVTGFNNRPGAAADSKFGPVIKVLADQILNIAEGFLQDSQAVTISANLTPAGVNFRMMADFDAASYSGKLMQQVKKTDQPLLAGLPEGKYMLVAGGVQDPQSTARLAQDLFGPVTKELQAAGDDAKPLLSLLSAMQTQMGAMQSDAMGLRMPTNAADGILQGVTVIHGDAKVIAETQKQQMANQQDLMKLIGGEAAAGTLKMTITPDAKTIGGVSLTKVQGEPGDKAPPEVAMMMKMIYGPNGVTTLQGIVNDKTYVGVIGGDDAWAEAVIAAAKANDDVLSKTEVLKAVNAELPANRAGVCYLAVDNIIKTVAMYVPFPGRNKLNFQGDLAPIGVAVTTDGSALVVESHIPSSMMEKVVAAFLATMAPGGNPGGGF